MMSFKLEIGTAVAATDYSDFYALAGVLATALAAFGAVFFQVRSAHRARMLEYETRGIALQNEAFARFYHIQWLVKELRLVLDPPDQSVDIGEFCAAMNANLCDAPVVQSFDIVRAFLTRAWPDLANIHPKQMRFLSGAFRRFEACLENYDRIRGVVAEGLDGFDADQSDNFWSNLQTFYEAVRDHAVELDVYFASLNLERDLPPTRTHISSAHATSSSSAISKSKNVGT